MHEDIVEYIRNRKNGVTSRELAENFLKFKNPPDSYAHAAIKGILTGDKRCHQDDSGNWFAMEKISSPTRITLENELITIVYCIHSFQQNAEKPFYIAFWDIFPEPVYKWGAWINDPADLLSGQPEMLTNGPEDNYNAFPSNNLMNKIYSELENKLKIFLTYKDLMLISDFIDDNDLRGDNETILVSELLRVVSLSSERPLTLESLSNEVLRKNDIPASAYRQGERFAYCVSEMFNLIKRMGIETKGDLFDTINSQNKILFKGKSFSYEDLVKQPSSNGVYGFKDVNQKSIYIGKSKNLKGSLLNFFRMADDSDRNVNLVQKDSFSFNAYECGSELESLLYEYRLKRKYNLPIEKNIESDIRTESSCIKDDCIVLIPYTNGSQCMSFWFNKEKKIVMKKIDLNWLENSESIKEIEKYFFKTGPFPDAHDLYESMIASDWIQKNESTLTMIQIKPQQQEISEIMNVIKTYLSDLK